MAAAKAKGKKVVIQEPARPCIRPVRVNKSVKFTSLYGQNLHPYGMCPADAPFLKFDMDHQLFCCVPRKPTAREHDRYLDYLTENMLEHTPTEEELTAWRSWMGAQTPQLVEEVYNETDPVLRGSLMRAVRKPKSQPYREKEFTTGASKRTERYIAQVRASLKQQIQRQELEEIENLILFEEMQRMQRQERQRQERELKRKRQSK